jgi:nucleoside-diphosphate-sugar epimerase
MVSCLLPQFHRYGLVCWHQILTFVRGLCHCLGWQTHRLTRITRLRGIEPLNIALTGGRGFIGRSITRRLLLAGHSVTILTRDSRQTFPAGCSPFEGDLLDSSSSRLRDFIGGADCLIHLAGEINDVAKMRPLHVDGTARLIDAVTSPSLKWIQISSCGVYGNSLPAIVDERSPCRPVGVYEETKFAAELMVRNASDAGKFVATTLRPSIVYGAEMQNNSLRALINAIKRNRFFYIGKPGALYNLVHVDDLAEAVALSLNDNNASGIYNVSTAISVESVVEKVESALNIKARRMRISKFAANAIATAFSPVPGFPLTKSRVAALSCQTEYSADAIGQALGWFPKVDLVDVITQLVPHEGTYGQ